MVQDLKRGKAGNWNAREAKEQYRKIAIKEAERDGKTPPIFPDSFMDFGDDASTLDTD